MIAHPVVYQPSFTWAKAMCLVVLLAVCIGLLPAAPISSGQLRAQPILLQIASEAPQSRVRVIVQKLARDTGVEALTARLGGVISADLHIINGFAAELPAHGVLELARSPAVRWVSLDAPVFRSGCGECVDTSKAASSWLYASKVKDLWSWAPNLQGQGVGVAVVDSGINPQQDLYTRNGTNRITAAINYNSGYNRSTYDNYGHGNHVAGIIGSSGSRSNGQYVGIAPSVNLINVKVADDSGQASIANVVRGLQWIYDNRTKYNIRVVNLSLNSSVADSYNTNPLNAAVEILWFNQIVVVVSAGNNGAGGILPPANDPFVITVGATDDKGTRSIADDAVASFSAYGTTIDGFKKPDLVAPGTNIVSLMANPNSFLPLKYPANVVNGNYFRMSGTSMAAPIVAGSVALLLQDEPNLNPDQVKYRLMATAVNDGSRWPGYSSQKAGAGYLDISAAIQASTSQSANTGLNASQMLWSGNQPLVWTSATWGSATWGSATWGSATWGSATWGSDYWGSDGR